MNTSLASAAPAPSAPLLATAEIADIPAKTLNRRRVAPPRLPELRLAPSDSRTRRRRLAQSDYEALGAFRQALRRFLAYSEAGAKAQGLTSKQHQALLAIQAHPGPGRISIGELAQTLLIKNHSAVGMVDRLLARGLVIREPSIRDRRRIVLELTAEGARILETISRNNLGKLKSTLPVFTDLLHALEQLELPAPGAEPDAVHGEDA